MAGYDFPEPNTQHLLEVSAVEAMYKTLTESREKMTVVAIGPLTNVALLLREHHDIKAKIAEIVWMGGAIGRGNFGALSEFNIVIDREAANLSLKVGYH